MIGKGTGTGRVTWLGPAKPDDPVFNEGWSISTQPSSRRKSSVPPSSTPGKIDAEADESKNAKPPLRGQRRRSDD